MEIDRRIRAGARASRVQCFASPRNTVPGQTSNPMIDSLEKNLLIQRIPVRTRESAREDARAPL
jgi:hypothetical protein